MCLSSEGPKGGGIAIRVLVPALRASLGESSDACAQLVPVSCLHCARRHEVCLLCASWRAIDDMDHQSNLGSDERKRPLQGPPDGGGLPLMIPVALGRFHHSLSVQPTHFAFEHTGHSSGSLGAHGRRTQESASKGYSPAPVVGTARCVAARGLNREPSGIGEPGVYAFIGGPAFS